MKNVKGLGATIGLGLLSLLIAGCAGIYAAPVIPPGGLLYSDISAPIDSDLDRLIRAWPDLPHAIRAGIVAMVEAARIDE